MLTKAGKSNRFIVISIVCILLSGGLIPFVSASSIDEITGFDKGPSYLPVVPLKKLTFVNYDENGILDDYAYLAAVPTAVFRDEERVFSYPLLFYDDKYDVDEDKERSLNARPGIDYFMEDWMSYCSGRLDKMTLVNVPQSKIDSSWDAREYDFIEGENPFEIASKIALSEWSYSKNAVIAVIEEDFDIPITEHDGEIEGVLPGSFEVEHKSLTMAQPEIGVGGSYESFDIYEPYRYVIANMYWPNVAIDLDLQLYDDKLGMADASSNWNILGGAGETVSSYVYNHGKWEIGITYMPTQSYLPDEGKMKSMFQQNLRQSQGILSRLGIGNSQTVDIDLFPGVELELDDSVPFGCRNIKFTLEWDNPNIPLGFVLLDPSGAETASAPSDEEIVEGIEKGKAERSIKLEKLGETGEDEKYSICVFALDDVHAPIDFSVGYSWQQNISRMEGDCLASATEGAVLASVLNAPLLYVSNDKTPEVTIDALCKLGVDNIYLVNLGNNLSLDSTSKLNGVVEIKEEFTEYKDVYDEIKSYTGRNDVIFSTVDPWTYYYADEQIPVDEYPGSLFIGPSAYLAAHHGSPVLLVDNHPELSQAIVWHTEFWRESANYKFRYKLPSVASMVLTGRNVLKFLEECGYDLPRDKSNLETMITVADHFDIGISWDRTFTGALIPGRFSSSPVDVSYWIPRSVFYPALIFENPALQGMVSLVNGSRSEIKPLLGKLMDPIGTNLVITKSSKEENYKYPILHTYNVYLYNFNRDASSHWGGMYTSANGITPYETPSPYSIDQGVTDKVGAYYPDLHETEVTPKYARKAGYSNCFSTNFEITMDNLNEGVIMWMESCHGSNSGYGTLGMWNDESPYVDEVNPWRAYERTLLAPRNLNEFVQYLPELLEDQGIGAPAILIGLLRILTKPLDILLIDRGCTQNPDVAVMNPQMLASVVDAFGVDLHVKESFGLSLLPIIGKRFRAYGDGVVIDPLIGGENMLISTNGLQIDDALDNLHSVGLNAVSCLVANTYLHQSLIRHGSVYQIMDPWSTSWYSGMWLHSIPRQLALGYTIGEAYEQGMAEVGIEYLVDQWWWDLNENVVFYGDPDLRVWTPNTDWDSEANNHWKIEDVEPLRYDEELSVQGHMPFGVTSHPREKQQLPFWQQYLIIIILVILLIILFMALAFMKRKE